MNLRYEKMYKEISYLLNYLIGLYIKEYLEKKDISHDIKYNSNKLNMKLTNNINNQLNSNITANELLNNLIKKLEYFNYSNLLKNNNFCNYEKIHEKMLIEFYNILESKNEEDNFIGMNSFLPLYNNCNKNNLLYFTTIIHQLLENYVIYPKEEFDFTNSTVKIGFSKEENNDVILPMILKGKELFIKGIINFKNAVNDYEAYKKDYDLFIEKFYNILNLEDFFDENIISNNTFEF